MGEFSQKMISPDEIYRSVTTFVWHQGLNYLKERMIKKRVQSSPTEALATSLESDFVHRTKRARLS